MRWEGESWRPRIENSDVIMNGIISKFAVSLLTAFPSLLRLSQKLPRLQYALADIIREDAWPNEFLLYAHDENACRVRYHVAHLLVTVDG